MDQSGCDPALTALTITTDGTASAESLAAAFGTHQAAAEAMAYLTGFMLEVLALHRGEEMGRTANFVRHLLERGPGGSAGVREPRRPTPTPGHGQL